MYSKLGNHEPAVGFAEKLSNLTLLAWDGAVIAARRGNYRDLDDISLAVSGSGMTFEKGPADVDGKDTHQARCHLGDFHHLSLFLETQFGVRAFD